jgi:hypothetical protein
MNIIPVIIIYVIFLGLGIYFILKRKDKKDKKDGKVEIKNKLIEGNYITPSEFNGGTLVRQPQYPSANNCDHSILYPINAVNVFYGSTMPDVSKCPCLQFVQAP